MLALCSVAAQILLQWGADVLAENNELRTPLKLAQSMAHNRTVEVLQQHAREEAEMMMSVRAELTEKRKQTTMAADTWWLHPATVAALLISLRTTRVWW